MNTPRRGCQSKRFRVYDRETEGYRDYSTDEFQAILWFSEKRKKEEDDARQIRDEPPMPTLQQRNVLG